MGLSEEQNAKIYQIYLTAAQKTDSIKTVNPGVNGKPLKKLTRPFNNAREAKMKKVLTAEQALQFETKKKELRGPKPSAV